MCIILYLMTGLDPPTSTTMLTSHRLLSQSSLGLC